LTVLFFGADGFTQFYEFGQDPASLKWKKLETEHFKIIYPSDFAEKSQSIARLMEWSFRENSAQLNHKPAKIPLILHNQSVYSNAFVTWAPKRMEFFTFPDPGQFPIDWLKELSLHETRHVIQISKINQGFTRTLSFILGQQASGAVAGAMPLWFIEGDAVSAETSLSSSGRGRLPSFEMEIKAQLLSGNKIYPLSKSYLGSYKDFVPDYYRIGYQMVGFARKTYGDDYWTNALDYIGRRPFLIFPYYFYSKKISGKGQSLLYKNTTTYLRQHWGKNIELRKPEVQSIINNRNSKTYTSYYHPLILSDSSVVALKTGLNIIPRFVRINSGGEEKIVFIPGNLVSQRYSVYREKIIWDEYVQDIRWKNRSYSIIREYDMATGKSRKISHKSKYISPSWSENGDSIVVVNSSPDYRFSLVILNAADGGVIKNIPSPDNTYLQYPEWIRGKGKIAVIATGEDGKSLYVFDLYANRWTKILKTGFINMDQLKSVNDFLFFSAGFNEMDEIYSFNLNDKILRKLTNSAFGAFHPEVSDDNKTLLYSAYGVKGYDIIRKTIDPAEEVKFTIPETLTEQSFISVNISNENSRETSGKMEKEFFEEKPYRKITNLFNIHSWAPFWYDYTDPNIDNPRVSRGITLLSQNLLSTAITSIGYERINGNNFLHSRFTYKGFYPVFDFSTSYGGVSDVALDTFLTNIKPDLYSTVSSYLPLTITSGKIITGLQPSLQFTYRSTYYEDLSEGKIKSGIVFFEPRIFLYSYQRTCLRDLQPRVGFTFDSRMTSSPFENELYGNIKSLSINLYLPGLLRNQGFKFKAEWQNQNVGSYFFPNHLALPRGYAPAYFIDMNKYSADYGFPIAYPDFSAGPLLYLKRIRGNIFIDYMKGNMVKDHMVMDKPVYPLSQGLELYADYHILRFIVEFNSGIRLSYFPHEKNFGAQILFSVNLDKF
jgi:hypothetical protein